MGGFIAFEQRDGADLFVDVAKVSAVVAITEWSRWGIYDEERTGSWLKVGAADNGHIVVGEAREIVRQIEMARMTYSPNQQFIKENDGG